MKVEIRTNYNDWEQLIIDGHIIAEGHKINADTILSAISRRIIDFDYEIKEVDNDGFLKE